MARIKRKGKTGAAKNFVTRTAAVNKLQVTLADFRRLCIFKGIFPREPRSKKRANKGSTKPTTFYYFKDIQYLLHEPVLQKFREHKTFSKKLNKAISKNELGDADRLEKARPKYTLDHLVRERYPTFLDALRDLDDPLNMLFLFANMPATSAVSHRVTKDAAKLTNQWLAYVAKERLITKVFVSIKGVYYQATIKGQEVRWLVPFKFPTNIPSEIDFKIMLTFLEFYSTMLHFVLFKLYADSDLVYPPPIDIEQLKGVGGLLSYVLKQKQEGVNQLLPHDKSPEASETKPQDAGAQLSLTEIQKAIAADKKEDPSEETGIAELVETVELDEFAAANKTPGDLLRQPSQYISPTSTLFTDFTFFVGREVPLDILELCVLSAGGKLVSEIALDELKLKDSDAYAKLDLSLITHAIVDRPKVPNRVTGRTYIQPQWVFDSINKGELVSASQYAIGETLPPHLSPWGDAGNYNPEQPAQDDEESSEDEVIEGEDLSDKEDEDAEEEDEDLKQQKELELEAAGVKYSDTKATAGKPKNGKKRKQAEEDEEKELKAIMMTKKLRKLYDEMQETIDKSESRVEKLVKKRKQLNKVKEQLKKF